MRVKAKLVHKYPEQSGVSQNTGNAWRRQEMKFQLMHDDWTEGSESLVVSCSNALFLDAPALKEGATGILAFWANAEEYNGRCYNRMNLNGWTPQGEVAQMAAQPQAPAQPAPQPQQFTPEQLAAAAAMLNAQQGTQKNDGLPF